MKEVILRRTVGFISRNCRLILVINKQFKFAFVKLKIDKLIPETQSAHLNIIN